MPVLDGGNKLITDLTPALAVRETHRSTGRLALLVSFAVAVALALFALPSTASATIGISNFTYTNSSAPGSSLPGTQAASHPNVKISFDRTGTQNDDVKSVQVGLPAGVFPNPEAVAVKCSNAQFDADACPSGSNVGTVSVNVTAAKLLPMTITGSVDVIQPNPNAVATMGLTLRPDKLCILFVFCAVPEKIMLETDAAVDTWSDHHVETTTAGSPKHATIGIPMIVWTPTLDASITIEHMELSFQSRAGDWSSHQECSGPWWWRTCNTVPDPPTGNYFWWQSPSCTPGTATAKVTSYTGQVATAATTSTPTGCSAVPFDPQLSFTPANTDSNQGTNVSFVMTQPDADATIQQSFPKFVDVDLPDGSGLDLNALAGVDSCTQAELQSSSCPASSEIGTAYAFSKFMPGSPASTPGLTGKVYATSVTSQVEMAVLLNGPRGTKIVLRGVMGARNGHVYSTFTTIPQVPFREFGLTITKPAYKNPAVCGSATSSIVLTGYSGAVANRSTSYTVGNCATPPVVTITGSPLPTTDLTHATFEYTSDQAGSTFQCKLDAGNWAPCTNPKAGDPDTSVYDSPALALGPHHFEVKALKGVVESAVKSYDWTVTESSYQITAKISPSTAPADQQPAAHATTPADLQAVTHPDVYADVDVTGVGQPQTLEIKMPQGFAASMGSVTPCDTASGALGTCSTTSPQSKIGTVTLQIDRPDGLGGTTPDTGTGDLYLTDQDAANDYAGGVSTRIDFAGGGSIVATGGAYLVENGAHQYLKLTNIPNFIGADEFQTHQLSIHLNASAGTGGFITNPSNCLPSNYEASSTNHNGIEAAAFSVPFQANGCATLPFGPVLTQVFDNPNAGKKTGVVATVTIPTDNSAINEMQVDEPPVLAPNFASFGESEDQCETSSSPNGSSFDPSACPPQAQVGTMDIDTPLLPNVLRGKVYLIDQSPIPWLGVAFDAPGIHIRMVGVTSTPKADPNCQIACVTRISIKFSGVPDVQIRSIVMNLNRVTDENDPNYRPPRIDVYGDEMQDQILKVATKQDPACVPSSPASSLLKSWARPSEVLPPQDQPINIAGCNAQ